MIDHNILIPLGTFFISLLGGHHFALIRDKRKEYNVARLSLYTNLKRCIETDIFNNHPDILQLELFEEHLTFYKKTHIGIF